MELDKSIFRFPLANKEGFELFGLCAIAVFAPMLVTQQILLGTIVNATLIVSALRVSGTKTYIIAFIPSAIAMLLGLVFGMPSHAVALMLPFIWLGNATLMFIIRKLRDAYWKAIAAAAVTKTAMLFVSSLALAYFAGLPAQVLAAFGIIQFITAMLGGALAYPIIMQRK